ncbi:unnamed protein product [Alopecurus aequalis]
MGQTSPAEDDFEVSGPKHMRSKAGADSKIIIDWDNEEHRRCVAACLVKGTCVMENDRTQCRNDKDALAPAWWESFGFIRHQKFINDSDEKDKFTYGAIFRLIAPSPRPPSAPEYVVAFRGTMLYHPKAMEELVQDMWVMFNAVGDFTRFKRTHPDVDGIINCSDSVWLAGHSLGASMALEIGRNKMLDDKEPRNVLTFLFNPPHVSPAPVINEVLTGDQKTGLYTTSFAVKFAFANALPGYRQCTKQVFEQLGPWVPELYVHPSDFICQGYIDYFEQRELVAVDHPRFASTAARASYRDMFFYMFSSKKIQPHLLPSARLWKNSSQDKEMGGPHGLRQWWMSDGDLTLSSTRYGYPLWAPDA